MTSLKARPTIFLSGVSSEFTLFRDSVETEIEMKGCFAENQPGFPPDYRTVEEMLRRKLHEADAVIHIVGFRFGAEPNQRPAGAPRRSYTQLEFDIARDMQKPVYVFLSTDASVRDPATPHEKPEDDEVAALQLAHRAAICGTNHVTYSFKDKTELCKLAAEIPPVTAYGFKSDISRIHKYAPAELIGREEEMKLLDDAWMKVRRAESSRPHVLTFVALGGEGKTSLVAKWSAELAHQDWPGCETVFAWSFYSQGTREQLAASSDLFLKEALTFFGDDADKEFAASAAGAFEKGQRLARIVGQRRSLLILDGLEPLQYAPTSPTPGQLKDQGIAALLKGLAAASHGLCVVTTRYSLPDLKAFWQTTAPEVKLLRLSREAGVNLLKTLGVRGTAQEFAALVEDVKGHALTLQIMGGFLARAFGGDIRQRDRVKFEKADEKIDGGHAFRAMAVYAQWMEDGSVEARRELAILRCLGLFDRLATSDCLEALLGVEHSNFARHGFWQKLWRTIYFSNGRRIAGLTEPLMGVAQDDWNLSVTALESANLLSVNRGPSSLGTSQFSPLTSLDTHPHIREYFSKQLREKNPDGWRAAHRRLYEHLCANTKEGDQPTLEDLQPLYQAVAHGCQAGLHQEVCDDVYRGRIMRGREAYPLHKLGAHSSDLGAIASFFEKPWNHISLALIEPAQAWLLNETALRLRALGRLIEALDPVRAALGMGVKQKDWRSAADRASNLSELELTLGEVALAVGCAEESVIYADRNGDAFLRMSKRATHADALHQADRRAEAEARFREAEQMQKEDQPAYPLLYSVRGFKYCDLLLAAPECVAWQTILGRASVLASPHPEESGIVGSLALSEMIESCRAVSQRTAQTLKWVMVAQLGLSDIALEHLTLGRAALYAGILEGGARLPSSPDQNAAPEMKSELERTIAPPSLEAARHELDAAMDGLRRAGRQDHLPHGLLTRACLRFFTGARTGPESAQEDLDEAWEIAERGPMKLFLADIHLYRARLFGRPNDECRTTKYPWESPAADLAAAEKLINECGYHRRDEELADAKRAILGQ
jgi:hypothetical protein